MHGEGQVDFDDVDVPNNSYKGTSRPHQLLSEALIIIDELERRLKEANKLIEDLTRT